MNIKMHTIFILYERERERRGGRGGGGGRQTETETERQREGRVQAYRDRLGRKGMGGNHREEKLLLRQWFFKLSPYSVCLISCMSWHSHFCPITIESSVGVTQYQIRNLATG